MSQHISVFYRTINKWVQKRYTFTAHRFPSLKIAALAFVQVRIYLHSQILNYGAESEINFWLRQGAPHSKSSDFFSVSEWSYILAEVDVQPFVII